MAKIGTVVNYVPDYEVKPLKTVIDFKLAPYVPFGSDNMFPQACALFARSSPIHRGIINGKRKYIIGGGITSDDEKLLELFKKVNFEGESIEDVADKFYFDRFSGGNSWIEIITDKPRSFLWFNHLDYTKCRLSKDSDEVLIHPDWLYYSGRTDVEMLRLPLYPRFEAMKNDFGISVYRSVIHIKDYEPEFYYYGVPQWLAGKDSVLIDLKTNKWNLARLKNAFQPSGFLVVPVKDKAEGQTVIDYIEKEHVGEGNQAKLMILTKSRAQDGEKSETTQYIEAKQATEGSWEKLHEQSTTDILIAHNWYRSLCSLPDNTGFDTHRILNEYSVALKAEIKDEQAVFIGMLNKVYKEQMNMELDVRFVNTPPIDDDSYLFIWEVRMKRGLDYNENDPVQQQMIIPTGYGLSNKE